MNQILTRIDVCSYTDFINLFRSFSGYKLFPLVSSFLESANQIDENPISHTIYYDKNDNPIAIIGTLSVLSDVEYKSIYVFEINKNYLHKGLGTLIFKDFIDEKENYVLFVSSKDLIKFYKQFGFEITEQNKPYTMIKRATLKMEIYNGRQSF